MASSATNSFAPLRELLEDRLFTPLGYVSLRTYFTLAIIGPGTVELWVEAVRKDAHI